jgi:AraC-like DNA-binding protein
MLRLLELPRDAVAGGLWYATSASTRFGPHFHHELELDVLVAGTVHYRFPHGELRIVAPSALWIPPYVVHELLDSSADVSMWVYSFRVHASGLWSSEAPAPTVMPPACIAAPPDPRRLEHPLVTGMDAQALTRLCALSRAGLLRPGADQFDCVLKSALALAWSGRRPLPAARAPVPTHPAVRRAASLLRADDDALTTEALAARGCVSRERLSRLFSQAFGIGLVHYRNHHRIQRFIHAYGDGADCNVLRAALDVGFGSYVQFLRAFKQVTGYTPAAHLDRVREGIVDPARTGSV